MTRLRSACLAAALIGAACAGRVAAQGFSPDDAVKRMQVPDGIEVKLVACEPDVRQPVDITFDDQGRMWVIQYLQYPTPAGLKAVKVDQYLRTVYDRVPEPPPKGPKGADRITVLSDPDENGHFRKAKDSIDGLNLCSGMCLGYGGVFVFQTPYLLFYHFKEGTDEPDGDPEVLLSGFGMEDAHAVGNSLQWGPDGWLYGAQGSTVTAHVRGLEFQQGIWRYHPITKEFELFAEGGGNTWGLDFDGHGNVIAGTNWGGFAMLHQVQGGYYIKGFGKHGPLHNPHSYGYFDHVPCANFKGGHVTCGGIVYQGGGLPSQYENAYIAGNLLSNSLIWYTFDRKASTFTCKQMGDFLTANDTWFRPIDCLTGPDGALYVADWYDKRANHVDPVDTWDRSNGRVYKIQTKGAKPSLAIDPPLGKRSSKELVALLNEANSWLVGEARRVLMERRDASVYPDLRKRVLGNDGQLALEALWALHASGGLTEEFAAELLGHQNEDVRTWAVRLIADGKKVSPGFRDKLVDLAKTEKNATVRCQLACSAKRLPGPDCLPIVRELLHRDEDADDPFIPMLLWWAIEDKAISDRDATIGMLDSPTAWKVPIVTRFIVERLAHRYVDEGSDADLKGVARLLAAAPGQAETDLLLRGIDKSLEGRRLEKAPAELEKQLLALREKRPDDLTLLRLAVRLGGADAYDQAVKRAGDAKAPDADRIALIDLLGQTTKPDCLPTLLQALADANSDAVRAAVLTAMQPFADPRITDEVLSLYPKWSADLKGRGQSLLCGRATSGLELLKAVDDGRIAEREVPLDHLRRLALLQDENIDKLIAKHWGKITPATAGEKLTQIRNIGGTLSKAPGDRSAGKALFTKNCATCHTLFGEGGKIGPDLTGADRKNRDWLLTQIVDPSSVIRQEFLAYIVNTKDGRTLNGLMVEQTPETITLVDAKNVRSVVRRDDIEDLKASTVSLMPEKLLEPLEDQQLRDLFAYLQGDGPAKGP
jgi:putative membrane-bound dehydrogenase-like protein